MKLINIIYFVAFRKISFTVLLSTPQDILLMRLVSDVT
jgi:hypothetical protein